MMLHAPVNLTEALAVRVHVPPCDVAGRYTGGSSRSHDSRLMDKVSQVCKVQQKHQRKWKEAMTF